MTQVVYLVCTTTVFFKYVLVLNFFETARFTKCCVWSKNKENFFLEPNFDESFVQIGVVLVWSRTGSRRRSR